MKVTNEMEGAHEVSKTACIDRMEKKLIIFMDSGDTIIDESTEIKDENGIVTFAHLIEGADVMLKTLYEEGYTIAMVADGEVKSFDNVYKLNGLGYCFKTRTISEIVGEQKPSKKMFDDAMEKNSLTKEDKPRIIMVGNNVRKDILGANNYGITSVLIDWSKRYNMIPDNEMQVPHYTIHKPMELLDLVEHLNNKIHESNE